MKVELSSTSILRQLVADRSGRTKAEEEVLATTRTKCGISKTLLMMGATDSRETKLIKFQTADKLKSNTLNKI